MIPQWIIEKKRDHKALTKEEITEFIDGYTVGNIPDYQMAALAMAIYLNGMTFDETAHLTHAMMNSGHLLDTSALKRPKADKHSTGGIGDKVSLILGPLVAACGIDIPMISGRGLGITGGTLDKFESIPGYRVDLSEAEMIKVIQDCGCTIVGQTGTLAPADKKLYALRDVTATVPSIPLITASIMCKKMAEGIDALVLDVKFGKGAFMKTRESARELAHNMVEVGKTIGKKVSALLTDMNQPLGTSAGNAVEVAESIQCLRGEAGPGSADLMEVTLALSAEMLRLTGLATSDENARAQLQHALSSGAALHVFRRMVELHGGDPAVVDDPTRLPQAKSITPFPSPAEGFITAVDAEAIGRGVLLLGAGRAKTTDAVDHAVGISGLAKRGDAIGAGDPLLQIHSNDPAKTEAALEHFQAAFSFAGDKPKSTVLVVETLS